MTATERDEREQIAQRAERAGITRVHALAWRDLDDPTSGGSEIHVHEILTRWAGAGLDVVLHAGAVDGRPATVDRQGVAVQRRGGPLTSWVTGPFSVLRSLDRRTDVLLEVWHGVNFLAPWWSRVPTVGIFHHVHTEQFHQVLPTGLSHAAAALERHVYPRVYRDRPLIALSDSVRAEMARELRWDVRNVHVVEPGVSERFRPGDGKGPEPLVMAAGRLMPQKRFVDAVDVLVAAKAEVPSLRGVIVGDGPERDAVAARIEAAGASSWIDLPGYVEPDALLRLYQQAWVLLSTSRREGWGMTVTEAAACTTPAVATDITGHREAIVDGETGVLAADTPGLARALVALLRDDARRAAMGQAAARNAARYRWDVTARRIFDVLADEAIRRRS